MERRDLAVALAVAAGASAAVAAAGARGLSPVRDGRVLPWEAARSRPGVLESGKSPDNLI